LRPVLGPLWLCAIVSQTLAGCSGTGGWAVSSGNDGHEGHDQMAQVIGLCEGLNVEDWDIFATRVMEVTVRQEALCSAMVDLLWQQETGRRQEAVKLAHAIALARWGVILVPDRVFRGTEDYGLALRTVFSRALVPALEDRIRAEASQEAFPGGKEAEEALHVLASSGLLEEVALPPGHPDVADSFSKLADYCAKTGQGDLAPLLRERAVAAGAKPPAH